jgi:P-type Cu+ transporter
LARARTSLPVIGLGCQGGGALGLEKALGKLPGVQRVYVNSATEMAYVEYEPETTGLEEIMAAIRSEGYGTAPPSARFWR